MASLAVVRGPCPVTRGGARRAAQARVAAFYSLRANYLMLRGFRRRMRHPPGRVSLYFAKLISTCQ